MTTNSTITLYNRLENAEGTSWRRWVIRGVWWHGAEGVSLSPHGFSPGSKVRIRIPVHAEAAGEYAPAPSCDFDTEWTIQTGDKVALGVLEEEIPPEEGTYTVTAWADNRRGSQDSRHLRISAE